MNIQIMLFPGHRRGCSRDTGNKPSLSNSKLNPVSGGRALVIPSAGHTKMGVNSLVHGGPGQNKSPPGIIPKLTSPSPATCNTCSSHCFLYVIFTHEYTFSSSSKFLSILRCHNGLIKELLRGILTLNASKMKQFSLNCVSKEVFLGMRVVF
jgi:hypothetical protein